MSAINRLLDYFNLKKIAPTAFEKEHGISNGYFGKQKKNKGKLGEDIILIVVENCLDLNLHWLITGKGEMIQNLTVASTITDKDRSFIKSLKNDALALLERIETIEKALL